jgi:aspartyl-tRNA(Asn)/glutamyl-tRNA(Gln) amidotransferase subunit A
LSWSLDTAGPIARTVDDTWLLWKTLQSHASSKTLLAEPEMRPARFRLGVPRPYFFDSLQPGVREAVESAISQLPPEAFSVVDVNWSLAEAARACGFIINRVETASVHLRTAADDPESFRCYGPELRVRVAAGAMIPASAYLMAQRQRSVIRDSVAELFRFHQLDALIAPTLPTAPVDADRLLIEDTGIEESLGAAWTRLTMPFNATGQPVLAIPCGLDPAGLPVGVQLAGKPGDEESLFRVGRAVEAVFDFSKSKPNFPALVSG